MQYNPKVIREFRKSVMILS